jgi:hypothetical protein
MIAHVLVRQPCRPPAALPAEPELRPPGDRAGSLHFGRSAAPPPGATRSMSVRSSISSARPSRSWTVRRAVAPLGRREPKDRAPRPDPGGGRTKTGDLRAVARDDRPWGGPDPPAVAHRHAPGRGAEHAIGPLAGFAGILQVDGAAAAEALADPRRAGPPTLASMSGCGAPPPRRLRGPPPAPVLRDRPGRQRPDRRGRARAHRRAPSDRDHEPGPRARAAPPPSPSPEPAARRRPAGLARCRARQGPGPVRQCRGHPPCPETMGRPRRLPRRRPGRARLRPGRAFDPAAGPEPPDRVVRRLRPGRCPLGRRRRAGPRSAPPSTPRPTWPAASPAWSTATPPAGSTTPGPGPTPTPRPDNIGYHAREDRAEVAAEGQDHRPAPARLHHRRPGGSSGGVHGRDRHHGGGLER